MIMETYAESTPTAHSSRLRSSKEKAAAKGVQRVNLAKEWSQSILDISGCGLTSLPPQLTELTSLEELILRDNKLTSLPDLSALTNLKLIDIGENCFTEFPETLLKIPQLRSLLMNNNKLTKLPDNIGVIESLKTLHLAYNELEAIPDSIGNMVHLESLMLHSNKIASLPSTLYNISTLSNVYLWRNKLTRFPSEMLTLPNLHTLAVEDNQIYELTKEEWGYCLGGELVIRHSVPYLLAPGIYLGDITTSRNLPALQKLGITHICALDGEVLFPDQFTYLRIQVKDIVAEDIAQHFEASHKFIDQALAQNGRVLIHCAAGKSRSPTIAASYLMKTRKLSYTEAFALLEKNRPGSQPNEGFIRQLKAFESSVIEDNSS